VRDHHGADATTKNQEGEIDGVGIGHRASMPHVESVVRSAAALQASNAAVRWCGSVAEHCETGRAPPARVCDGSAMTATRTLEDVEVDERGAGIGHRE
jgi:hypothetical protein